MISFINIETLNRHVSSVTRLGEFLDFGQLFKDFGNIFLPKSHTFLGNFFQNLSFFLVKSFLDNFYRLLAIFSGHNERKSD